MWDTGRVASFVLDRPRLSVVALLMMIALALAGAAQLKIDFSSTSFYRGEDEMLPALEEFREQWGPDDDVLLLVVRADDGGVLDDEHFEGMRALGGELLELEEVVQVESIAGLPLPEELKRRAPFIPLLISEDGRRAAVAVRLGFSSDDLGATVVAVERLGSVVDRHAEGPLEIGMAGIPAIRAGFFRLTLRDQMIFVPAALVLIGLSLLWVFRRMYGVFAAAFAAGVPTLLLVGCMGWAREPVGLINQAYFTLIPVLAVADAIHMVSRYDEELGRGGMDRREAIVRAVRHVGLACLLTTTTTAAGFWSLGLARMPILRSFGVFAGLGMVLAYATLLVVVPLVLSRTRANAPLRSAQGRTLAALARFSSANRWPVIVAFAAVAGGCVWAGQRVVVDNRLGDLLLPDHPVRVASDEVDASLGGILGLEVDLRAREGVLEDPDTLRTLRELEDWAAAESGVRVVIGPGHTVLDFGELSGMGEPTTSKQVGATLAALDAVFDSSRQFSEDRTRARVTIRVAEPGGRAFEELAARVDSHFRKTLEPLGVESKVTGTTLLAYRGVNRITDDLRNSLALIFGVVSGLILLLFRSIRVALLSLLPNGLPLLVGYGVVGLAGWTLDPLAAVILALGLGIAVDDTIHILARVREELERGADMDDAVATAVRHSGRAVTITSLVLAGGLAINILSSFPPLQMLGKLGAVVILTALVCDLILLPALLSAFGGKALLRRGSGPRDESRDRAS